MILKIHVSFIVKQSFKNNNLKCFRVYSSVTNIEESLKNILIQDLLSKHPAFGQIKVDTSSIVIKRDLEHTYHSEQYVKEALNESMAINNVKSQIPPNTKDKTLQSRIGVVRKTTIKPNQSSKNNDPDEPDIDTENIPVVQGSFQITKTEADITENKHSANPSRNEEKVNKGFSTSRTTTTLKSSTTKSTPFRNTSTKKAFNTTPRIRPITIKSTLNIKPKIEEKSDKQEEITTRKSIISTPTTVKSTVSTKITTSSTTTVATTTRNVSQILFDLLTNENHGKDLPKIDTLFTLPHVIDNEPWRPITRPYYETTSKQHVLPDEDVTERGANDRIGVAEVVEDTSLLESILNPIPPAKHRDKTTRRPSGLYNMDPHSGGEVYVPSPVYTSFTLPAFIPPLKDMETLGSSFPKPHPLPVDKISSVVEIPETNQSTNDDDGKPIIRPPKDKKTSVTINVVQSDQYDNSTEKVSIEGMSILKKQNTSTVSTKLTTTSTSTATINEIITTTNLPINDTTTNIAIKNKTKDHSKENSTKRPNNKVSIIPSTSLPHHTWELVNTSTNSNGTTSKNSSPEKYYNDTLQAIITKNDAISPNTTPRFPSKLAILRNLTDIIKRYSQNTPEKQNEPTTQPSTIKSTEEYNIEDEHHHLPNEMTGYVEVVSDEDLETTTARIITLMPAKSNLGVNRPLRPRPKIEAQEIKEEKRSFLDTEEETETLVQHENIDDAIHDLSENVPEASEIVTTSTLIHNDKVGNVADMIASLRTPEIGGSHSSGNRLPKSHANLYPSNNNFIQTVLENTNASTIPQGTYRVSYHVSGSVSTKQANKTQPLPAYELALGPDVVLDIPVNQTGSLTADKLKQLANLATISDFNNNSLFRAPGGIISTKAIPSSYALNSAGFKILTKTYNKLDLESSKQGENHLGKPEKNYSNPQKIKDIVKEVNEIGKNIIDKVANVYRKDQYFK